MILFHAGTPLFSGGFVGVDVFFVISGYLITSIIGADIGEGRFSLINFYERRARRILPALFTVLLITSIGAWHWLLPLNMLDYGKSLMAVATFGSNFLFWSEDGYFNTASEFKPLLHTWSLAVEEQYYVLFPLALILFWPLGHRRVFGLLVLTCFASIALAHWGSIYSPGASFYLLPTRAWELLSGALCALYLSKTTLPQNAATKILGAVGLVMIGIATVGFDDNTLNPSLYTLLPVTGTVFIILFAQNGTVIQRVLSNKLLVWVGLLSYGTYLWHQPLFVFARFRLADDHLPFALAILGFVALLLAWISYRFVEKPFRNRNAGFSRATIFSLSGAMTVSVIGFGYYLYSTDGAPNRFKGTRLQTAIDTIKSSPKRQECHTKGVDYLKPLHACRYHSRNVTWAVLGDSHGVELSYALASRLEAKEEGVLHLTFSNCGPENDTESDCGRWTKDAVVTVLSDPTISNIVVTYRMASHLFGGHEYIYPDLPNTISEKVRNNRWDMFHQMLETLSKSDKQLYYVVQAPEVQTIVARRLSHVDSQGNAVSVPRQWWDKRTNYINKKLSTLPSNIEIINPVTEFCDQKYCYAIKDYQSLYFDDDHMSVTGATIVADMILNKSTEARNKSDNQNPIRP